MVARNGNQVRRVLYSGITITGPNRVENQDAIVADGRIGLKSWSQLGGGIAIGDGVCLAVVDGMGGYEGGAEAASLAACSIARITVEDCADLDAFFSFLSQQIGYAGGAWFMPNMGAAVAMIFVKQHSVVAHH